MFCKFLLAVYLVVAVFKGSHNDRVGIFSTIDVTPEESAGDVACVFCTVNLRGDVHGDMAVVFGTVNADPDRTISGDMAAVFSTVRLGENDRVNGDLASVLSTAEIPQSVTVGGSRAVVSSGLGIGLLLAPLFIVVGVIWLIVYLVRRNRYPYAV